MTDYGNKPYVWWPAKNYPEKGYLKYNWRERKTDQYIFMGGHPVPQEDYDLILQCGFEEERLKKMDLLPGHVAAPIINQRAIDILSTICPNDFQVFPVIITNSPEMEPYENRDYFLLNITQVVDSVDRENSYLYLGKDKIDIRGIRKLVLEPDCMGNIHLAREKFYLGLKLISPILLNAFKKEKIKGGWFLRDFEAYNELFPEEYLDAAFSKNPEAAKRYFVAQMNDKEEYAFFKTRIPKIPPDILEALIDMTLSRSSFHKEQCEEILDIVRNIGKTSI